MLLDILYVANATSVPSFSIYVNQQNYRNKATGNIKLVQFFINGLPVSSVDLRLRHPSGLLLLPRHHFEVVYGRILERDQGLGRKDIEFSVLDYG